MSNLLTGSILAGTDTFKVATTTTYNLQAPKPPVGYWNPVEGTFLPVPNKMPSRFHQWMMSKLLGWKFTTEVDTVVQNSKQLLKG